MKVLYITNALTHYYNLVLNKLNQLPATELAVVVPYSSDGNVGEGVYQTKEGISFKVYELDEVRRFLVYRSFSGIYRVIKNENPDIVIVIGDYLSTFLLHIPLILHLKRKKIKLIMQSIPFRLPRFEEAKKDIFSNTDIFRNQPGWLNQLLYRSGVSALLRYGYLYFMKLSYSLPDAFLVYVDAGYDIYGSYGVRKECIFITYNSPDTDTMLEVRRSISSDMPILPINKHRLIHVGRLVEWKRVDMLIRALARVKSKYPDAELLVIGYGPQEQKLKDLADALHLSSDVKFIGGVYDQHLLGRYFMASSIYVLAGMGGLSINDAMTFGLPVICSVCDGTEKTLVRDEYNGKIFHDGDEDDLVDKIIYLFDHPQLLEQMGTNSTSVIQNEINIHTVIKGFTNAFDYVTRLGQHG